MRRFRDRADAGAALAARLSKYRGRDDVVVLGLPRGGVPVAAQIAERLGLPMDIFVVRKLGLPGHEELAMGAIASGGTRVLNREVLEMVRVSDEAIDTVARREGAELERRKREYRGDRPEPEVRGRVVILVDDGLATGSTMRAAVMALRQHGPKAIVVAVPVAARETCDDFRADVDEIVCAMTPEPFHAVGLWYEDFSQTTDDEVRSILAAHAQSGATDPPGAEDPGRRPGDGSAAAESTDPAAGQSRLVRVDIEGATLEGDLTLPANARGVVLFAHGSGSSRHSPRNQFVAQRLNESGLCTLLLDLLTPAEEDLDRRTRQLRFDIEMLANRLVAAVAWLRSQPRTRDLEIGLFGASTGGGAALVAAAAMPHAIHAVVSRGGRPDLAGAALPRVQAPTLLIVGGDDVPVIGLNREAMARMTAKVQLEIVPGASHLFEEHGKLEIVADAARDWFIQYLVGAAGS
ncbi:MAG TPA: alpha/beta family hydrolase [Longimicrobiaceae bacterium]|nr:alpha/beta family hydrolase [Longimicrobiaceae bacterium]